MTSDLRTTHSDPLIRIVKREDLSFRRSILIRVVGILISLLISGLLIVCVVHINPVKVYVTMFEGAFGSKRLIWNTVRD
nr:ABC transporter permease [Lachnospiraceae bacterium]